mmetsp:Transcript_11658/g.21262  ORF Transcript_11658/g.21262 Transcript_11658/m.21262 type:complete len:189 (-) Transcript_11658:1512-2078(-)
MSSYADVRQFMRGKRAKLDIASRKDSLESLDACLGKMRVGSTSCTDKFVPKDRGFLDKDEEASKPKTDKLVALQDESTPKQTRYSLREAKKGGDYYEDEFTSPVEATKARPKRTRRTPSKEKKISPIGETSKVVRYRGVTPKNRKFQARIRIKGSLTYLGVFETPEEAAKAYDRVAKEHQTNPSLNFS